MFRWLLYGVATVVIVMALAVGALRLLLPLVPDYQENIRGWASEATGYDIRFGSISASWPLSGPELSLYDVRVTQPGEAGPIIAAREVSAGLSLWRLVRDARPSLDHVAIRGATLAVERTATGELLVQGRRLEDLLPRRRREHLPELDLILADIAVTYLDPGRGPGPVAMTLERLRAGLDPEKLSADATLALPGRFGRQAELELEVPGPLPRPLAVPADWKARFRGRDLDLANVLAFALGGPGPLRAGEGDVTLELAVGEGRLQRLHGEFELQDVGVATPGPPTVYQQLAGTLDWQRREGGWQAEVANLRVRRDGRDSPAAAATVSFAESGEATPERWGLSAAFLRLDDLFPLARAGLAGTEFEARLPGALRGDLKDLEAEFAAAAEEPGRYSLRLDFEGLGGASPAGDAAVSGLTGSLAADGDGGRLQLASRAVTVALDPWFREPLQAQVLEGLLIWRTGTDGIRFLSDDVRLATEAIDIRSRLELVFPGGDASPVIDLKARASASEAREVLRYLPLRRFPPKVVDWLERAVVAGRVPRADVEFRGPLREFPYDQGEGVFRVTLGLEGATLDYANGWPRVEGLEADVVFDGVGMTATARSARLGGLALKDYAVRIPDLRRGVLAVSGGQRVGLEQIFDFLRVTPLAARLGPTLDKVTGSGPVDTALRLALPITRPGDYNLQVLFDARGCRLGWRKLPLDLRELRGRVRLENTRFTGAGLEAQMLGETVRLALRAEAGADGAVTQVAEVRGATPVARVTSTFNLPLRRYLEGNLAWDATVTLPPRRGEQPASLRVAVRSDLQGLASSLPPPLTKPPSTEWPLQLDLAFPAGDAIEVTGRLTPPFAWALRLVPGGSGWRIERGMLRAGPGEARLPTRRGVELVGRVEELPLGDWLALGGDGDGRGFRETYREATLQVDRLVLAGQLFREVNASAQRGAEAWAVRLAGPGVDGNITVPFDTTGRPLVLDMKRLWLLEAAPGAGSGRTDPRKLPALQVKADDLVIGELRFGRLDLVADKAADGLVARRLATRAPSFQIDGTAAWRVEAGDPARQATRLEATLLSTDFRDALERLGVGPVVTAEQARVSVNLTWPDGPKASFLEQSTGQISMEIKDGQVLDLEPGSGRLLGLLSVTALPRRLALDFSDVFRKGFAFDVIKGDFRVGTGDAYTCNLGLTGPAADIGIVGRTGFGGRDYDQFAVVRPQLSSVLTAGGAVLGGPVGGVTMLLISQLFRKPLSTLGETYYRVTGGWDKPSVNRVERAQLDASEFKDCEQEVAAALQKEQQAAPPQAPAQPRKDDAGRP